MGYAKDRVDEGRGAQKQEHVPHPDPAHGLMKSARGFHRGSDAHVPPNLIEIYSKIVKVELLREETDYDEEFPPTSTFLSDKLSR